jgi:hypothetical protein
VSVDLQTSIRINDVLLDVQARSHGMHCFAQIRLKAKCSNIQQNSFKLLESESALAFMDVGPIAKGRE